MKMKKEVIQAHFGELPNLLSNQACELKLEDRFVSLYRNNSLIVKYFIENENDLNEAYQYVLGFHDALYLCA